MEVGSLSFKRLMKDVRSIMKQPLHEHGIYYSHNEDNILKGYALIIGPEDTPYAYGYYLFQIDYPPEYPLAPPKFTFLTNGDNIRMNPNLYRSGKVCVSILNTWRGDQWSSCQTLKTILLTLLTILNDKPLLNEPGYNETSDDFISYNNIITYKNIEVAILNVIDNKISPSICSKFKNDIIVNFKSNYLKIMDTINKEIKIMGTVDTLIHTKVYSMRVELKYNDLKSRIQKIFKKYK